MVQKDTNRSSGRAACVLGGVALILVTAIAGAAGAKSLEQRLRVLEDREEITRLITSDYGRAIDLSDTKILSALFTEDGEFSSEWADMAAIPEPLRVMFAQDGGSAVNKVRPRITFKGRATIANYMSMVFRDRPKISFEGGTAIATFIFTAPSRPAPGDKAAAPQNPMLERYISMKHLITNPSIELDGDNATATSYWIEVAVSKDDKHSIAGGGYYADVLKRVNGAWRFKQRVIYNHDIGLKPTSESPAPAGAPPSR